MFNLINSLTNKIDQVINYYCLSFAKTKIVKARHVAGSRRPTKIAQTQEPPVPMVFVTMSLVDTVVTLRALLDSGAGALVITSRFCDASVQYEEAAQWATVAGRFNTHGTVKQWFKIPELNPSATINYNLHVAHILGVYNMILGRDLLTSLGLVIDLASKIVIWNDTSIPMKESASTPIESFHIEDPDGVGDMVGCLAGENYKKILEAKYKKADLQR